MAVPQQLVSNEIPDEILIRRILAGEKDLYEHIIRRYNQRLYRVGMSVLNNEHEVEDAMQNAYINAYRHLHDFEHRASLATWLTRIMLNECYSQKRKTERLKKQAMQPINDMTMKTPATILANTELNNVLETAIGKLPEKYRLVFVLREMEDLSVAETSEALNIEASNVKVRLNRARLMLRENLSGYMKDHVFGFHLSKCNCVVNNVMAQL